jgi:PAS domain S-box-containing protein
VSSTGAGPFGLLGATAVDRADQAHRLAAAQGGLRPLSRLAGLAAWLVDADAAQVEVVGAAGEGVTLAGVAGRARGNVGDVLPREESSGARVVDAAETVRRDADDRSFLGVPLRAGDDPVGALCLWAAGPRTWTDREVALVEGLASAVTAELELATLRTAYDDDRRLWQLAVDAAGVGAFDWDLTTGALRWDERLLAIFGHDRESFGGTIEAFTDCLHPDDRDRVGRALDSAIESVGTYAAEYRVVRPDGEVRWVEARGQAVAGDGGTAVRLVGAAYDTTVAREGEARVARTLESMPTAFFHLDHDWRFTYANPEARRLLGGIGSDVVGHVIWELFPAAVGTEFEERYRGSVASGVPASFEAYYPPPLDAWYEVRCWPSPDGLSVYFLEVTERRLALETLDMAARRSRLVAEVTSALTATLDGEEAVARLARLVVPALGDWCVVTVVDGVLPPEPTDDRGWRTRLHDLGWWHHDPAARPLVRSYARSRIEALTPESLIARALRTRQRVLVETDAAAYIAGVLAQGTARALAGRLAPSSAVVVPLPGRGRVAGLISVFRDQGRPSFDDDDLDLLSDVAARAGLALDNVSLYTSQRELAETLQRSLLTEPPEVEGLEVAVRYEPASETAQVGGDWYDAFEVPGGGLTLVIGDVIGHDTTAAAAMGQLRGLLRGVAVTTGDGPARSLERVEEAMAVLHVDTLASVVVARIERADGRTLLRWANAGHPPPVVVRADDAGRPWADLLTAEEPDTMLGLADGARTESVAVLAPGDVVLLYTDGLVERRGESIDHGLKRLCDVLVGLERDHVSLHELADRTLQAMLPEWTEDDVAVVAVRIG